MILRVVSVKKKTRELVEIFLFISIARKTYSDRVGKKLWFTLSKVFKV